MKHIYLIGIFLFCLTGKMQAQEVTLKLKVHTSEVKSVSALSENAKLKAIRSKVPNNGLRQLYPGAKNPELLRYYVFTGEGNQESLKTELYQTGLFEEIKESEIYEALSCTPVTVNDPLSNISSSYGFDLTQTYCAWNISKGSPNILIGIADSEFEPTHEDLTGKFASLEGEISGYGDYHGTMVAGIAAANTNNGKGVAGYGYNCKIAAHRIKHYLGSDGGARASSIDIGTAVWNLYQRGLRIINLSWTGVGLDNEAIQEITENGTVLVVAAGNLPEHMFHQAYAHIPGVINVTNILRGGVHGGVRAQNAWVDICAPGPGGMYTLRPNNTYTGGADSSSESTPVVSGIIGLMLEVNPYLTPARIENIIKETAEPIANPQDVPLMNAGYINAYRSVMTAGTRSIANKTYSGGGWYLTAGYGFNFKNVTVQNNAQMNLVARKEVVINGSFEVQLGSTLSIDFDSTIRTNGTD